MTKSSNYGKFELGGFHTKWTFQCFNVNDLMGDTLCETPIVGALIAPLPCPFCHWKENKYIIYKYKNFHFDKAGWPAKSQCHFSWLFRGFFRGLSQFSGSFPSILSQFYHWLNKSIDLMIHSDKLASFLLLSKVEQLIHLYTPSIVQVDSISFAGNLLRD